MSGKRVEYHQGATADVKSAVAWYQQRSPKVALDFIEELHRAADTILEAPGTLADGEEWHQTIPALAIPVCHHLFRTRIRSHNLGCRPRQQATGVLGRAPLSRRRGIPRIAKNAMSGAPATVFHMAHAEPQALRAATAAFASVTMGSWLT